MYSINGPIASGTLDPSCSENKRHIAGMMHPDSCASFSSLLAPSLNLPRQALAASQPVRQRGVAVDFAFAGSTSTGQIVGWCLEAARTSPKNNESSHQKNKIHTCRSPRASGGRAGSLAALIGGGSGGFLVLEGFGRTNVGGGPGGEGTGESALNEDEAGRVTTGESVNPESVAKLIGCGEAMPARLFGGIGVTIVERASGATVAGAGEGTVATFAIVAVRGGVVATVFVAVTKTAGVLLTPVA